VFAGIWALMERSLRTDARNWWSHGLRLAAILSGYGALWSAIESARWFGAPGLHFFEMLVTLNGLLIAAGGIGYFSSTITEEKEEGTLGLMLMAGLNPLGILLGKFGSRLMQAGLLVLLQIPFALLAVTLGGVTLQQVAAAMAALLSLLFLTANLGLLASVLSRNSRQAAFRMTLAIVVYCLLAFVLHEAQRYLVRTGRMGSTALVWINEITQASYFTRVSRVMSSGWSGSAISVHEMVHVTGGLLAFGLAWGLFGWATRQPDSEPLTRGWLGFKIGSRRLFTPGRVWSARPIPWKEFYFLIGGWPWLALKLGAYLTLMASVWIYWHLWLNYQTWSPRHDVAVEVNVVFLSLLLALEGAVLASRIFHDEVRGQTWSSLAGLPASLAAIAYTKAASALAGLAPVLFCLFWMLFGTESGRRGFGDIMDDVVLWGIVMAFTAVAHLAALFSLYVRWGTVPLAAAAVWLPFIGFMMILQPSGTTENEIGTLMVLGYGAVCAACHALIGHRLAELAAA
jgi:ABC-type transport system involved in multi-copper enzyme maturation permease subunit